MDEPTSVVPTAATHLAEAAKRGRKFSEIYQPPKRSPSLKPAHILRDFLLSNRNCDVDQKGHNRLLQIYKNMIHIATNPKSPFAVAAANFVFDRALGKPKPSDEEIDAIAKGGIQLVLVSQQPNDPEIPVRKELPESEPKFLDGEVLDE